MTSSQPSKLPIGREHIECDACGKPGASKRCSRCNDAFYCSKTCQIAHWKNGHKGECTPSTLVTHKVDVPKTQPTKSSNETCYICLEESIVAPFIFSDCGHKFCSGCLQKWQGASPDNKKCPACRKDAPNVADVITKRAEYLSLRAMDRSLTKEEKKKYHQEAVDEYEKIDLYELGGPAPILRIQYNKAHQLLQAEKPKEALELFTDVAGLTEEGDLVNRALMRDANREQNPEKATRIAEMVELRSIGPGQWRPKMGGTIFDLYCLMAQCKEAMEDYLGAIDIYAFKLSYALDMFNYPVNNALINYELGTAKCLYHLEQYDMAIEASEKAIRMDRCFPQVHKYLALSQKAKGDLKGAIRTMGRAVNYETNYDNYNRDVNVKFYQELLASAASSKK